MPKNRMVRPDMWTDDKFVALTPLARLLFIGMWNFACDNGHLDDSNLQLKMRVLPADNCDVGELLDELLASGMVTHKSGYLKVVNLSDKQPLDLRFLVFCDHCTEDPERHYQESDKKPSRGNPTSGTRESRAPTTGTRRSVDVEGGVEGGGGTRARKRAAQLPEDWQPNDGHRDYATTNQLDLPAEVAQFSDHHRAKGSTMKDWDASFRTWLRNAVKWRKNAPAVNQSRNLPHASELELPPDGLSPAEYDEWEYGQREKRRAAK